MSNTLLFSQVLERVNNPGLSPFMDTNIISIKTDGHSMFEVEMDESSYINELMDELEKERKENREFNLKIDRLEGEIHDLNKKIAENKEILDNVKSGDMTLTDLIEDAKRARELAEFHKSNNVIWRKIVEDKDKQLSILRQRKGVNKGILDNITQIRELIQTVSQMDKYTSNPSYQHFSVDRASGVAKDLLSKINSKD